jgi:hypothetical protein
MIRDNFLEFSVAQDLTGGTGISTNVVDMLNARDIGPGDQVDNPGHSEHRVHRRHVLANSTAGVRSITRLT